MKILLIIYINYKLINIIINDNDKISKYLSN